MSVWMFPGQGIKELKQAHILLQQYPNLLNIADQILGYRLEKMLLNETEMCLQQTDYAQPLLYLVNCCQYYSYIEKNKHIPRFLLGHSLGEYNALWAADVFDFETGLQIVAERGRLMREKSLPGLMIAVIGLTILELKNLMDKYGFDDLDLANINSIKQIVVAGNPISIKCFCEILKLKNIHYVLLNVTRAFHSRHMQIIHNLLDEFLAKFNFFPPKIHVISNVTAEPYQVDNIKPLLCKQVYSQVQWLKCVEYLLNQGETHFCEIGTTSVLSNLVAEIKQHYKQKISEMPTNFGEDT